MPLPQRVARTARSEERAGGSDGTPRTDLCVVGYVYFEVHVPALASPPRPGEELFVSNLPVTLGGALNTASVARALGVSVALAHPSGAAGLTDAAIRHALAASEMMTLSWPSPADPALSLILNGQSDRSMVSARSLAAMAACPELPAARWIHVPGLCEARLLSERLASARARGAKISVSGSFAPDELAALRERRDKPWDQLVLNAREAAFAAGSIEDVWSRLAGVAVDLVVTDGPRGALGVLDGERVKEPSPHVEVVDTTGAGDAFCAGLLVARLRGLRPEKALGLATRVAARIVSRRGGAVLQDDVLSDLGGEL